MMLQTKLIFLFLVSVFVLGTKSFGQDQGESDSQDPLIGYEEAFVFGIVEGVTEFLPISSTGHLILTKEFLVDLSSLSRSEQDAIHAYLIVIQVGAIIAVAILYAQRIIAIILGFWGFDPAGKKLGLNIICAFIPAALLGPILDDWIEVFLFGATPVGIALIVGAVLMGWAEKRKKRSEGVDGYSEKSLECLSMRDSLIVGLLQCVAMCPGTSRSMMTIVGGYFVGLSRKHSAEFSFLLGLVTLTAAAGYKVITKGTTLLQSLEIGPMLFGCLIAGFSAALSVRWLVGFLTHHGLGLFVWYRVIFGIIVLIFAVSF
jgi:undecaprenyl-diphosphatase